MIMNHKLVYQIDIREFFYRHKSKNPSIKNLLDLPAEFFDDLKSIGVDFLWLLGIYEPSLASREISISMKDLHKKYYSSLPDWKEEDVIGSPYAITSYKISREFGGEEVYKKFREKIRKNYKLKVILDFVPNHFAIDSPVVQKHPEFFIRATEEQKNQRPDDFITLNINGKEYIFAHGREPFSPVWKDTLQIDYRSKSAREFMMKELLKLSKKCDGVRCDMSMLLLSDVFFDNWKDYPLPDDYVPAAQEFWSDAISKVKKENPDFIFIAEVYWHREGDLLNLGFDYVYDKIIYEFLVNNQVDLINEYIKQNYTNRKNRFIFLENHDEQRSAHIFTSSKLQAGATLIYTLPGMKLIYDGQLEGREFHHAIQLRRLQEENEKSYIKTFYRTLFSAIKKSSIPEAYFKLLEPIPAWEGSPAYHNFIIYLYEDEKFNKDLVVINLSPYQSQCKVKIESYDVINKKFLIKDRLSDEEYVRDGNEMFYQGLYLDLKPYQSQIFEFIKVE